MVEFEKEEDVWEEEAKEQVVVEEGEIGRSSTRIAWSHESPQSPKRRRLFSI